MLVGNGGKQSICVSVFIGGGIAFPWSADTLDLHRDLLRGFGSGGFDRVHDTVAHASSFGKPEASEPSSDL